MAKKGMGLNWMFTSDLPKLQQGIAKDGFSLRRIGVDCGAINYALEDTKQRVSTNLDEQVLVGKLSNAAKSPAYVFETGDSNGLIVALDPVHHFDEYAPETITGVTAQKLILSLITVANDYQILTGVNRPSISQDVNRIVSPEQLLRFVIGIEETGGLKYSGEEGLHRASKVTGINIRVLHGLAVRARLIESLNWPTYEKVQEIHTAAQLS